MAVKNTLKKIICLVLCLILAFAVFAGCGSGSGADGDSETTIHLTLGSGHPPRGMSYIRVVYDWWIPEVTRRVEENTDYRIEWNFAWAGSVAGLNELLSATEVGILDIGILITPFEPSSLFLFNLNYYIPFNSPCAAQVNRIMRQIFDEFPEFFQILEENYNQRFLALSAVGNMQLLSSTPIRTLEDVNGIRVASAGPNLVVLNGTGAIPIQGDLTEAYTMFQTGLIDGWTMFPSSTYSFRLHEVASYQSNLDFGALATGLTTINLDTWNSLPVEVQNILVEVSLELEAVAGEMANLHDAEALESMLAEGFIEVEFPFSERERWAASLPNVAMEWALEAEARGWPGVAILERYMELLEAEGFVFPRDWRIT